MAKKKSKNLILFGGYGGISYVCSIGKHLARAEFVIDQSGKYTFKLIFSDNYVPDI